MRKIQTAALIGLGAIGGYVAPKLQVSLGDEGFTVIAGGDRKRRLEDGCCINDQIWKFRITAPEEAAQPFDLVIFSVKYQGLEQAALDAAGFIDEHTILMSLLNGVESEDILRKYYPNNHILYSVIRVPSMHEKNKKKASTQHSPVIQPFICLRFVQCTSSESRWPFHYDLLAAQSGRLFAWPVR